MMKRKNLSASNSPNANRIEQVPRVTSPYTGKTVDNAITHLEHVLRVPGVTGVLGMDYWRARVDQLAASPGLAPTQHARIARLQGLLKSGTPCGRDDPLLGKAA
jgi:hypothetical protein